MLTGASGQLGTELRRVVPDGVTLVPVDRSQVDLTDSAAVTRMIDALTPAVIINAAAYTAVDRAEQDEAAAVAVNVTAAATLARGAKAHGARMIHVSTDYVFGGPGAQLRRWDDAPSPLSVYARTKLEGEQAVVQLLGARATVFRTSWLYSVTGTNFVKTMLRLMRERDTVSVVVDQVGSPTWARSLAGVIWAATRIPTQSGVFHWSDAGVASWYDLAVAVFEEATALGLLTRAVAVLPIGTASYPTPARRPTFSALDSSETVSAFGVDQVHWRTNLRRMLGELANA